MEKKVIIPSTTGSDLHSILYTSLDNNHEKNGEKPPLIILCHGFTGDKYEWGRFPEIAIVCNKEGIDALIFDFSGSGENERIPIRLYYIINLVIWNLYTDGFKTMVMKEFLYWVFLLVVLLH